MLVDITYNRERAVEYARRWANDRNPLFTNFTGRGGDCTNFISQCIFAGCPVMNFTQTFGWYYISEGDRAPAWSGVDELYSFLTGAPDFSSQNGGIGPYGALPTNVSEVQIGDIIQLRNTEGNYYHTLIISGFEDNDVLVCAHSDDALDRRLSTYNYASLRIIHILGGRIFVNTDMPFSDIINGVAISSLK